MNLLGNPIFLLLAVILSGYLLRPDQTVDLFPRLLGHHLFGLAFGLAGYGLPPVLQSLEAFPFHLFRGPAGRAGASSIP